MRVYKYGLLPPTEGAPRVDEQIQLAHAYQNKLVEIERSRRAQIEAFVIDDPIRTIDAQIEEAETAERKDLWAERKRLRKERFADPKIIGGIAVINSAANESIKAARGASGLYWGTYAIIEQAIQAAKSSTTEPKFHYWNGNGAIAVQIQITKSLSVEECLAATDTRLRIDQKLMPVPGRGGKARPRLWIRTGSDGRAPIWAVFPLIFHRPLPEGGQIKWAKVIRERTAGKDKWSLHLTVDAPAAIETSGNRVVALDLGWRMHGETTRAGGYCDGVTDVDVVLEPDVLGALDKCDDIRSISDQHVNVIRGEMKEWREAMPPKHAERCKHVALWKSPAQFAAFALWLRDNRYRNDHYDRLEEWRQKDKHLWLWEANARKKAVRRRRDQYRCLAKRLAESYDGLVIEKINLARLADSDNADLPPPAERKSQHQRTCTAPSELRAAMVNAFRREGKSIFAVQAQGRNAVDVWKQWREQGGEEKKAGPARSLRYKRLRGLPTEETVSAPV